MKAIMVMFDSLNRHMLPPYGCDWVKAPNFQRLAEKTVTFDTSYVGSMPCMPARREIHTGRYNFLHRSWGPIEPFDDSMPEILKRNGVYTHLVSDHFHYWEEGGCNYHTRYNSWEISRGKDLDPWKGNLTDEVHVPDYGTGDPAGWERRTAVNRHYYKDDESQQPQPKTFALGMEFIRTNHKEDNWFLQLETFDPHESYFCDQKYRDLYPHDYDGPHLDAPPYREVNEDEQAIEHLRCENAALISMCDEYLGRVIDLMDELDLWQDTMLIVNTDHGILLGEHMMWGKMVAPWYDEVARTPLFIWDPRCGCAGERRSSLVQTIDLPATLLDLFCIDLPADMQGIPLRETIATDKPVRQAGLFGTHGAQVNVTDGRYVYMRASVDGNNGPLFEYTHMPTHMSRTFAVEEMHDITLAEPFSFTKGCKTMKIPAKAIRGPVPFRTELFDLESDPRQEKPIDDERIQKQMIAHMVRLMEANDAPAEQFERLGLELQTL